MKLHARHTVGFLNLAAIELNRIAREPYVQASADELGPRLRMIARKMEEEAVTLDAALKPPYGNNEPVSGDRVLAPKALKEPGP